MEILVKVLHEMIDFEMSFRCERFMQ